MPQLPDNPDEYNAVAKDLGVAERDIHLRGDASETTLKHARLSDYSIVYLATHGLVADDVKGLAEPSLALSIPAPHSTMLEWTFVAGGCRWRVILHRKK